MRATILVGLICSAGFALAGPPALTVPLGKWLVVREATGKGLKPGSGVRFRAEGFDTASSGKGSANPGACTATGAELKCDSGLAATAVDATTVRATMGPIQLTLAAASAAESASFDQWLADSVAQQAACSAAAKCCHASEKPLGVPCDLKAVLGDRSLAACKAGLDQLRSALASKKVEAPAECRP